MGPIRLRRGIGYVIQESACFPFTVERNIGLVPAIEEWPAAAFVNASANCCSWLP